MEAPLDIDMKFLLAVLAGDLLSLQKIVEDFENGEGPGKVPYAKLKTPMGYYALHAGAVAGKTDVCRFLVEKLKLDINVLADFTGETPLFFSIQEKHRPTTIFLLDNGADITKHNVFGETPLHWAAIHGSKEIVKLLISKGADLNAISDWGTPLHFAARSANRDVLKYLLDLKAEPNPTISSLDMSPLNCAMNGDEFIECIELLLKAGADPNRPCYLVTPLRLAAPALDERIIRCLLEAGADPNVPDFVGNRPIECAALVRRQEVVELLFPVTDPIPYYPDWSIRGVLQYVQSEEGRMLLRSRLKKVAPLVKAKGDEAFRRKNYVDAIQWYTQAAQAGPFDVKIPMNRCLCYIKMDMGEEALTDAQISTAMEPGWAKAHYREGAGWNACKKFQKAAESFSRALSLDPGNKEIEKAYGEVQAARSKFSHWYED